MNQTRRTILDEPTTETADYRSADLNVAAFLMARGFPLVGVERSAMAGSRRHTFLFPPAAAAVAATFVTAQVNVRAFANAYRDLKSVLHSQF